MKTVKLPPSSRGIPRGVVQQQELVTTLGVSSSSLVLAGLSQLLVIPGKAKFLGGCGGIDSVITTCEIQTPKVVVVDYVHTSATIVNEVLAFLRNNYPGTVILMIVPPSITQDVSAFITSGVKGFVEMGDPASYYEDAVLKLAVGGTSFPESVATGFLDHYIKTGGRTSRVGSEKLSPRELQVLKLLLELHFNKDVASMLRLSVRTIEKHRQRIMKKLGVHSGTQLATVAFRLGIVPLA